MGRVLLLAPATSTEKGGISSAPVRRGERANVAVSPYAPAPPPGVEQGLGQGRADGPYPAWPGEELQQAGALQAGGGMDHFEQAAPMDLLAAGGKQVLRRRIHVANGEGGVEENDGRGQEIQAAEIGGGGIGHGEAFSKKQASI